MGIVTNRVKGALWGLLLCVLISLLTACRTKYVPVVVRVRDSVVWQRSDSVVLAREVNERLFEVSRDCVVVTFDSLGVPNVRERYRDRWRDAVRFDSSAYWRGRYDSLCVVRRVEPDIEDLPAVSDNGRLTWWEQFKIDYFNCVVVMLFGLIIVRWIARSGKLK